MCAQCTHEDTIYFKFNSLLGLAIILTDLMTPQCGCGVTKFLFRFYPISNTLAGADEERIFNLIDHLRNELLFRLEGRANFPPQDG